MSSLHIDIQELSNRLGELLSRARQGEEIILMDNNVPRAKLVPITSGPRREGLHPGAMQMSEDFDEPLSEDFWLGS